MTCILPLQNHVSTLYIGIKENLKYKLNPELHPVKKLQIQNHVDGVVIFDNSTSEMWPILGRVITRFIMYKLYIIATYYENSEPKNLTDYLFDFI